MVGHVQQYLRRQADVLLALSRTSIDVVSMNRLRSLAGSLNQEAEVLERSERRGGEGDASRNRREEKRDES